MERSAKVKVAVIVCAAVAVAFLTAFFVVFGVWRSKVKSRDRDDSAVYSATCDALGEISLSHDAFYRYDTAIYKYVGKITVNGTDVEVTRKQIADRTEAENCGHFVYGETEYFIVVHSDSERLYGALYYDAADDEFPTFIEKLVFCS
ncbi:MAG: hypothetical protein NC184_02345 [Roseburia sp.]|nr:hypothetical protein [Roseburia sp.]